MKIFETIKEKITANNEQREEKAYLIKSNIMENLLGKEHDMVMHAIIPYEVGGTLDLYYYPQFMGGTAVATKELVNYKFSGPNNNAYDCFEFVMCTRYKINMDSVREDNPPKDSFAFDHKYINSILNFVSRYSSTVKLNPHETIEFPIDFELVGGKCLIIDCLSKPFISKETNNKKFGLMLIMEIHRSEMEYAMKGHGKELIQLLKLKKVYPFTGIDREPVI